jgi:hypothetical protein
LDDDSLFGKPGFDELLSASDHGDSEGFLHWLLAEKTRCEPLTEVMGLSLVPINNIYI